MKRRNPLPALCLILAGLVLSSPAGRAITVLPSLAGGDLTDPENDGDAAGNNYNATFNANDEPGFGGGEFAFNVFNNTVGGGNNKWCCGMAGGPEWVTATFPQPVTLSHFTLTSGNDSPNRDPADFEIQGTNGDPLTGEYTTIYSHTGTVAEWTARNQTLQFDGGGVDFAEPAAYTTIRLITSATSGGVTTGAWHQLNEFEIFGAGGGAIDTDMDGLDDSWEQTVIDADPDDAIETLADVNPGDDLDGDTLTNLQEFMPPRTNPLNPDSDNDGYRDNVETSDGSFDDIATDTGTDPNNPDTDGDSLVDGVETNDGSNDGPQDTGTSPLLADSDNDGVRDDVEIAAGFDPNDPNSRPPLPPGITVLGIGSAALLGGDLTDPEDDGTPDGLNYDAIFDANDEPGFGGGEFAFNVFNNTVGGGNNKWCCGMAGGPEWVTATFPQPVTLSHFTLTSGNDSPNRDPADFEIQGTNGDPVSGEYTTIYSHTGAVAEWTARNQVLLFTGGGVDFAAPASYTTLRMLTTATQGGATTGAWHQLNEIEYFGTVGADADFKITNIDYDSAADTFRITWASKPGRTYSLHWSPDLSNWDIDIDDSIDSQGDTTTYPPVGEPGLDNPAMELDALFFRAELNAP